MNAIHTGNVILSSLLTAQEFKHINLDIVFSSGISKAWFVTEIQKDIFEVMNTCQKANVVFDEDLIIEHLKKTDIENPRHVVLDLLSLKQVPQNIVLEHIKILRKEYHKQTLKVLSQESLKMLDDETLDPDAITVMMQNTLNDFEFLNNKGYTRSLAEVRKERKSKPPVTRIRTYIPFIDTTLTDKHGNKGFRNEGLIFVSGLKQSGKTFTVARILENVSKDHPVLFGSLEFGEELYDESIEEAQEDGYFDGNIENIYTFDKIYDIDKIVAEIRFQHKLNGIKLVALDSMMRIINTNPDLKTDEKRLSEIFSKLGMVSKELKIPILIVVQSSKEDLKSSMISVKGSMNADHEAFVWYHMIKTDPKNPNDERRTVIWNKNKDTHKHPKQYLMFVPQTKDFYQYEIDEQGNPSRAMHKYRKPKEEHAVPVITVYEATQKSNVSENNKKDIKGKKEVEMPEFDF